MVATDGDAAVIRLLAQNAQRNCPDCRVETLLWGAEEPLRKLGLQQPPDLLLMADVIYASVKEDLTRKLIGTMLELTGAHTLVLVGNMRRFPEGHKQSESHFFAALGEHFECAALPVQSLHADFRRTGVGSCGIHPLRRRPSSLRAGAAAPAAAAAAASPGKRARGKSRPAAEQAAVAPSAAAAAPAPAKKTKATKNKQTNKQVYNKPQKQHKVTRQIQ